MKASNSSLPRFLSLSSISTCFLNTITEQILFPQKHLTKKTPYFHIQVDEISSNINSKITFSLFSPTFHPTLQTDTSLKIKDFVETEASCNGDRCKITNLDVKHQVIGPTWTVFINTNLLLPVLLMQVFYCSKVRLLDKIIAERMTD